MQPDTGSCELISSDRAQAFATFFAWFCAVLKGKRTTTSTGCVWKCSTTCKTTLCTNLHFFDPYTLYYTPFITNNLSDQSLRRVEDGLRIDLRSSSPLRPTNWVLKSYLRPISPLLLSEIPIWVLLTEFICQFEPLEPPWNLLAEL